METNLSLIFLTGLLIISGFVFGELARLVRLPKACGYLLAGLMLNPGLFFPVFEDQTFITDNQLPLNMALSAIAFSIGAGLHREKIRSLGKAIGIIGISQSEVTLALVCFGLLAAFKLGLPADLPWLQQAVPIAIILGALALPTDPAAFMAVKQELRAEGKLTTTILGIAAIDDLLTFLNYVLALSLAGLFINGGSADVSSEILHAAGAVVLSVLIGIASGIILNLVSALVREETEGVLIVMTLGFIFACFGLAQTFGLEKLLATMAMGITVVNYNPISKKIITLLERYTEEFVFVIFFTLSGVHLKLNLIDEASLIVLLFIMLRFAGKWLGAYSGALLAGSDIRTRHSVPWALLPQGGIVIGLALAVGQRQEFAPIADLVLGVVIISSVFYEILGTIAVKSVLRRSGETSQ